AERLPRRARAREARRPPRAAARARTRRQGAVRTLARAASGARHRAADRGDGAVVPADRSAAVVGTGRGGDRCARLGARHPGVDDGKRRARAAHGRLRAGLPRAGARPYRHRPGSTGMNAEAIVPRLDRTTTGALAERTLRDLILEGALAPGTRL